MTIPGAEKVIELGLKNIVVFATEQTVKSRTYNERVKILDANIHVQEISLPGYLVRDIELLLPVQRCQNEDDFNILMPLYAEQEWNCDTVPWQEVTERYFSEFRASLDAEVG